MAAAALIRVTTISFGIDALHREGRFRLEQMQAPARRIRLWPAPWLRYAAHQMIEEVGIALPSDEIRRDLDQGFGQHGVADGACRDFRRHLSESVMHPAGETLSDRAQGRRSVHRLLQSENQKGLAT